MQTSYVVGATLLIGLAAIVVSADQSAEKKSVLRHVVLFKFREGTTDDEIKKVEEAFAELPKKIDTVKDYEWGTDVSPEKLSKGFTHCFFLTFESDAGRDTYLKHADHTAFVQLLLPKLEDALVVDYWTH